MPDLRRKTPSLGRTAASRILGAWIRTRSRGSTGGPSLLARYLSFLHALPVAVPGDGYVFVDLRDGLSRVLLAGSPWSASPFEQDEQTIMNRIVCPGDVVWDIGAHVGIHTVLLCSLVRESGRVHAFEANPMRYRALTETVCLLPNAVLHSYGLGSASGSMPLFVPEDQTMASLADFTKGRVGRVVEVQAQIERADDLLSSGRIPAPHFIKCDVEGAEYDVFRGAAQVLDRADAPLILYEADTLSAVAFGRDMASATLLLKTLRHPQYEIYWVTPGGALCPIDVPAPPCEHFNLLAVPRGRRDRISGITVTDEVASSEPAERHCTRAGFT